MKKKHIDLLCGSVFSILAATQALHAQAGLPDPGFGTNGIVITDIGMANEAYAVTEQPDGKILVGGFATLMSEDFSLVRYNSDGSPDTSFGNAGIVTLDFSGGNDRAHAVLLQPDGKIVLAGFTGYGSGNANFAAARFLSDGAVDLSFGTQGKVSTDLAGNDDYAFAAALQADGKIVVGGPAGGGVGGDYGLVRYQTNGSPDMSFNGTGILLADISGAYDCVFGLAVQSDGKILANGYSWNGIDYDFSVARFNSNGSFDNTFGSSGKVITPVGPSEDIGLAIALQPDGKIVVAGYHWNNNSSDTDYGIVRYNTNGSLDNSFGTNGKATGPISNTYDYLRAVAVQPDGKIVAAGQTSAPGFTDLALLRFNTNGSLDTSFNGTGIVIRDVNGEQDYLEAVAIQSDGKIIAAGTALAPPEVDQVVLRYLSDPDPQGIDFIGQDHSVFIYPNPLDENSVLEYTLDQAAIITIELFDLQGRLVSVLQNNQQKTGGTYRQPLGLPADLAPGTYMLVLSSEEGRVNIEIVKP